MISKFSEPQPLDFVQKAVNTPSAGKPLVLHQQSIHLACELIMTSALSGSTKL